MACYILDISCETCCVCSALINLEQKKMNPEVQNIAQEGLNWSKRNPGDLITRERRQNEESEMKTD